MDQNAVVPTRNPDYPWDEFDPFDYLTRNYLGIRRDDAQLMRLTHAWFAKHIEGGAAHGVDVGCGPNLYPALAMLPSCHTVTLLDYSQRNITWLHSQVDWCSDIWRPYWDVISPHGSQGDFEQIRARFAECIRIRLGSVFRLPVEAWDLGTMFFVAESITRDRREFEKAVMRFLRSLRSGAPFAAAFMERSEGYEVAGVDFPAVAVEEDEVRSCLAGHALGVRIHRTPIDAHPLRPGYSGILLALGTTA